MPKHSENQPNRATTDDAFLGGKLWMLQPKSGYRAAIDAVCLAASVAAQTGDKVLDIGMGVGVSGLCLAWRVPGIHLTGLEIQSDLTELARLNIERNNLTDIDVVEGDIMHAPAAIGREVFDHVLTNPPFYDHHKAISPPDQGKSTAHMHSGDDFLKLWIDNAIEFLKPKGTLTLVYPAERLDHLLTLISEPLGDIVILPLWPGNGKPAKRVIVSGQKETSGVLRLLSGLRLHVPPKRYAPEAEKVLRDGEAISFD